MSSNTEESSIIVVGAGIIGASVAYQLALRNQRVTLIEQCAPACAASGKSGGFLAKDWCDSSPLKHLARPSYEIHNEYGSLFGERIAYRTLESYSISLISPETRTSRLQQKAKVPDALKWVNGEAGLVNESSKIGTTRTNAQVLPKQLTEALIEASKEKVGTDVLICRVEGVKQRGDGWILDLRNSQDVSSNIECDVLVLCMGPWTIDAQKWFPCLPAIMAHKAASLVIKATVPATALFTEYVNSRGEVRSPEAYPRHDEVYLCQSAIPDDLAADPNEIRIASRDVADLKEFGRAICKDLAMHLEDERRVVAQACNLPISPDGLPIIGAIPGTDGKAFVAAGHSCWGILNSPATGVAIAELIVEGRTGITIGEFDPARFYST